MMNTSHKIDCACKPCRNTKSYVYSPPTEDGEKIFYLLAQHKVTKEFKYFLADTCDYCGEGYIIKTKIFDRCVNCGKDAAKS